MARLTDEQNARLGHCLGSLEGQLRDDIRATLLQSGVQHHADLAGMVHDLGDESVANMLIELGSTLLDRHLQELREIQAARRRLTQGDIDCCLDCRGDIGYERLLARPIAVRCVPCQQRHEKTFAHEASPRM